MEKIIEIPFGAFDSELKGWEYTIPEGMEAKIENGKIIVREKESEDEKIRKGLLRHFRNKTKPYWNEIAVKDIIAYLEKQKEQKPAEPDWCHHKVDLSGCSEEYMKAYYDGWNNCNQQHAQCEAEQKPVEWSFDNRIQYDSIKSGIEAFSETYSFNIESRLTPSLSEEQMKIWRKEIEQAVIAGGEMGIELKNDNRYKENKKPAEWSEEDEGMLNCIIATLCEESHGGRETNDKMVAWLENRLKILRPQPKAKLTLLDENIIEAAVAFVEQNDHFNCWGGMDKRTVIKALRSLRPHWKPSEEHMGALYAAIELSGQPVTLQSLYNDLKKLL